MKHNQSFVPTAPGRSRSAAQHQNGSAAQTGDPRRRNRNIGTSKSGHGANNRLSIPDRWCDLAVYWEKLVNYVAVKKPLNGRSITFLVEPPRTGHTHHCTIQDVLKVLEMLPPEHVRHIKLVVFRQPTAKQRILMPVWGRLGYWSDIGKHEGPGVYLEAQPTGFEIEWGKSLGPNGRAELDRYREVGFRVEPHSRGYHIHTTPETIRASQLYRTVPHEVGHYVDYLKSKRFFDCGDDCERFWELYGAKPSHEKEVFAHRYADEFRREMEVKHLIPFSPTYDPEIIRQERLMPEWFAPTRRVS